MADYISREPMIEEMRKLIDSVAVNFPNATETELIILKGKYEAFIEYIQKQPAADVQPVKRGEWDGYVCSECNECADYFISGDFYFDEKPNFCPNCGARMDGEQNENN